MNFLILNNKNDIKKKNQDEEGHYNLEGDLEVHGIVDCEKSIHCCKFSPSGDVIAVGLSNGVIKIYKKSNYQLIYILLDDDVKRSNLPVTSIRFFNPPNDPNLDHYKIIVASYVAGYIKYWHYPSKSCIYTIYDQDTEPVTIDFNRTFETMAVGGYNSQIKIYDVATKKLVNVLENGSNGSTISGHSSRVYCVKYNPNNPNQLFSGGWDDTLQIWDHRMPESQHYIYGPHICGEAIDVDADHNHLITGSWRKTSTLQIWDLRNYGLIRDVFKNKSLMMIYSVQWLAKDYIFACGSDKNSAIIFDRGTLKPIGGLYELKYAVSSIDNDRHGEMPNLLVSAKNILFIIKKKSHKSS